MSTSIINKLFLKLLCIVFLSACSSAKSVYNNLNPSKYEIPIIYNFDDQNIVHNLSNTEEINYQNKIILNKLKNQSQYHRDINIVGDKVFALNRHNSIIEFNLNTGEVNSTKSINFLNIKNETIISFIYLNSSFIIAIKSGSIINVDLNGDLIWEFSFNKILNTRLSIVNDEIIALYIDEIKSISSKNGSLIWAENFSEQPIYQAKGGQLARFLNLLFFILPNNEVGSIDMNFGVEHDFIYNEIPLITSINNIEDKIHIFDNYFTYLDEGRYLYTVDLLTNNFTLFKKTIKLPSSSTFFNNSLIVKEGEYLQAININNGKSFWLIESNSISSKSVIIASRNVGKNIEIFLDNGDVLVINNKKLIEVKNLDINNIHSVNFDKNNIIINTNSGQTVIF